ncbi:MAG: biotin-dependent carboxyltransferase family protein [Gemmobacter sp.]
MSRALRILRAGPGVSVQDRGRPGHLAQGLSRSGAADLLALAEGAALLGQDGTLAALEIAGSFVVAEAAGPLRIALTGSPLRATIDGAVVAWHACHALASGSRLEIVAEHVGTYGYLHVGGGFDTPVLLGARAVHMASGLGRPVAAGDRLPVGADAGSATGLRIDALARFGGGTIRVVPSLQTDVFPAADLERFEATVFRKDARGNRIGQRLIPEGDGFATAAGLHILSETIVPGDIQITGDGLPYVLLSESQTTGGYPRIGAVLPCDLPRLVQAPPAAALRFRFVSLAEAVAAERAEADRRARLRHDVRPLFRDPADVHDLLTYQLISGVTAGDDMEEGTE